jgi:hypothetical protein
VFVGQFVPHPTVVDEPDGLVEHEIALQYVLGAAFHEDGLVLLHLTNVNVA